MLFVLPFNLPAKKISVGEPGASRFQSLALSGLDALDTLLIVPSDKLPLCFCFRG